MRRIGSSLVFGAALLAIASTPARADFKPIGVNLSTVNYYSTEHPFKDFMRQADAWRVGSTSIPADHLQIDADGWVKQVNPGQYFSTYVLWDLNPQGRNPHGYDYVGTSQLVLHYDGEGTMQFGGGYQVVSNDARNKRIVLAPTGGVKPTQGVEIKITSTNPGNYLRNLRLTKPEFENDVSDPWDPTFLSHWQELRALRFMDWGQTNSSPLATWSQRTPASYFTQQGRNLQGEAPYVGPTLLPTGVNYETMIALSNRLDKDLWLCVPHDADDAYVTQLATLVNANLEPGRKVYVEHSNEVWNSIFQQYPDSVAKANALIAQGQTQLDAHAGDFGNAIRYHGLRTKQIGQIFDGVLGADRVVTVLGTMQVNTWVTEQELGRNPGTNVYWDPQIKDVVDAVAVADYVNTSDGLNPASADDIFADLFANSLPAAKNFNAQQKAILQAVNPNLQLIAYEGGQHLGYNVADPSLYIAANRDPRMGEVYDQLLSDWYSVGGELFMAFDSTRTYSQYGSWGLLEAQGQDVTTAPKYKAVLRTARELPGDFNSDGQVDSQDLEEWRGDFKLNGDSDADGDNDSDGADLLYWQRQLGSSATPTPLAAAPEPASSTLVVFAGASFRRRRHARRP